MVINMDFKLEKNMVEYGVVGVVLVGFLVIKLAFLDFANESKRFLQVFLGQASYEPVMESGVVVDNYGGIFAYICNLFNSSVEIGGVVLYLGLFIQIFAIMLLTISVRLLVGDIGGTFSIIGFSAIFIQSDPMVSFITLIAALQICMFARFYTRYFSEDATIAMTIICGVLFGLLCSIHATMSTYGLYLSFVLILAGVILVQKYQLIQMASALIPFLLINFLWRGYSLFTYRDYMMKAVQDLGVAIKGEHFGTILTNVLFLAVVAVICFNMQSQKLVFTIFLISISQLLYAISHDFDEQGTLAMYLFVVITAANAVELFYQSRFVEEDEIEIKRVDAHAILKDVESVERMEEVLLKEQGKLSTSKMDLLESAIDRFTTPSSRNAEKRATNVIDTSMNQDEIIESHIMNDWDDKYKGDDFEMDSSDKIPSVRDILGDLSTTTQQAQTQEQPLEQQVSPVVKEVEMLENPLPVPKKHEPTEMEYAINLTEFNAEFDLVNFGENLKYDIP